MKGKGYLDVFVIPPSETRILEKNLIQERRPDSPPLVLPKRVRESNVSLLEGDVLAPKKATTTVFSEDNILPNPEEAVETVEQKQLDGSPRKKSRQQSNAFIAGEDEEVYKSQLEEKNVGRNGTLRWSERLGSRTGNLDSNNMSLTDDENDYQEDSEFIATKDLKNDHDIDATSIMRTSMGYVFGFKAEKKSLEKFYNKQTQIKYKYRMRKAIVSITFLVFLQEILLWIAFRLGKQLNPIRISFFAWVFFATVYLLLSTKVYKFIVVFLIFSKTFLHQLEMYYIVFHAEVSDQR